MTVAVGALVVVGLVALALLLLDGGPTALPRRITTGERDHGRQIPDFEIAVTDYRGDVDDRSSPSLGTWLAAGGVLLAAVVGALLGSEI